MTGGHPGAGRAGTPNPSDLSRPGDAPSTPWWRAAVIGGLAVAFALALLATVWLLHRPLMLLVLAIVVAETLRPLVNVLDRRIPRGLAIAVVYLALAAIVAGLGWLVLPRMVEQSRTLVAEAPNLVDRTRAWADRWDPGASDRLLESASSRLSQFGTTLVDLPMAIVSSVIEFVVVIAMSIYWLSSSRATGRFVASLLPSTKHAEFHRVAGHLSHAMGGYFRSEGIGAVVVAVIVFAGLTLLGLDYAVILALIAGAGELIPVVGPIFAAVPAVAIALLDSPFKALQVVIFYALLQQFESNILVPKLMQRESGLPPLIALFALLAGGATFGILGALFALPFAAAVRVLIVDVAAPAVRRWTGAPDAPHIES